MNLQNNPKLVTTSYSWDIRNFDYLVKLCEPGDILKWASYISKRNIKAWKFHIYPKGKSCADYISFYLSKINPSSQTVYNCTLSIGRPGTTPVKSFVYIGIRFLNNIVGEEFFLLQKSNSWISKGPVRFQCDITEMTLKNPDLNPLGFHLELPDTTNLSNDIGKLLKLPIHSDLTVDMNGNEIYIHKYVLLVRCPKLSYEFGYQTIMEMPPTVETEVNVEIFEQLMHYIYNGKLRDSHMPLELFRLAERLSLASLMKCVHEQAYSYHVCLGPTVENQVISWNLDELNFLEGGLVFIYVLRTNFYVKNLAVKVSATEDSGSEKFIHISFTVFGMQEYKPIVMICKISLTSQAGLEAFREAHHIFSKGWEEWDFPQIPYKKDGKDMCLTAELSISDGSSSRSLRNIKTKVKLHTDFQTVVENLECLRIDMNRLRRDLSTTNLILLSADYKLFRVHDGIMWARWPGVEKVIETSSVSYDEENIEVAGQLEIKIPSDVLKILLKYLYTGFISNFDLSKAEALLKYSNIMEYPDHLVKKCEAIISYNRQS